MVGAGGERSVEARARRGEKHRCIAVAALAGAATTTLHQDTPPHTTLRNGTTKRWVYADAAVYSASKQSPFALRYALPGLVATLGVVLLGLAGRTEDDSLAYYDDDGAGCRGRCALFVAYVISFGSIFGAATMLLVDRQRGAGDLWAATAATVQTTVVCGSGLLLWLARNGDDDGDGYGLLS